MKTKLLDELYKSLHPYRFLWEEWISDSNCNLSLVDITLANSFLNGSLEITFLETFLFNNKRRAIKELIRKLDLGYQIFKDFVIVQFLFSIIKLGKQYGYNDFLVDPISQLNINRQLKESLLSFKAYTLQQLFIIYKVEDFGRAQIYKKIVNFHACVKTDSLVNQE